MLFTGEITIPAGTPLSTPVEETIKLTKAIITNIDVYFPPGNACKAFITFHRSIHQIFPLNTDGYIKGNALMVSGRVFHQISDNPIHVIIKGYSPEAEYEHTVYFNIWMKHAWQLNPFSDEFYNLTLEQSVGASPFT